MSKLKGLVPGGEKTSHASGNDITYTIQESGRKVKIEGDEYHLCASALQSEKIHEFKDMTTKEVLDEIYTLHSCDITPGKANTGDFIVCKVAVRNPERRNWTGTVKELLNIMQSKYGCNLAYTGKEKYDMGGPVELLAPNGKPSNLTPEQYKLVRTPEFKAWFGDWENDSANASKVVDENGEPKVMWHFSKRITHTNERFNVFRVDKQLGSHFGTRQQAEKIKELYNGKNPDIVDFEGVSDFRFYEVFLNIRNPLRMSDVGIFDNAGIIESLTLNISENDFKKIENIIENKYSFKTNGKEAAELLGFDGVIYLNRYESNARIDFIMSLDEVADKKFKEFIPSAEDSYVAFHPNQIKLADGTNTTFDGENPDIRFAKGGSVLLAPNGKPTNLTPEQYKLVRTPEFKAWFGDFEKAYETGNYDNVSKVIDEETKEPLVVYHGTKDKFSIFDLDKVGSKTDTGMWGKGFYFSSSKKYAETYANKPFYNKTSGYIFDVFLSLKNPYFIKNQNDIPKIITPDKTIEDLIDSDKVYSEKFRETLVNKDYDGVFVKFEFKFRGGYDYELVAFEPNQIKLADGTNTTFDGENPDIRFAGGGMIGRSRTMIPKVRGEWTKDKILRYLKEYDSDTISTYTLTKFISELNNWQELKSLLFYHGTANYIERGLKPSIVFSERTAERIGGGGYGQRYWGISLTKRKRTAESFSGMSRSVTVYPVFLKKDAVIIERTDLSDASEVEDIIVELYEKGIDAVWIGGGEEELVVVNPRSIMIYKKGDDTYNVFGGFKSKNLTDEEIENIYEYCKSKWTEYNKKYTESDKDNRQLFLKSIEPIKFAKGGNISVNPAKTPEEVAMMHGVSPEYIRYQAETGTESEMKEHGCDRNTAYTLTMHHLEINPDCYCLNDFTGVDKMNAGGMMIAKVMPGAIENSRKSFECGYAMFKKYGSGKKSLSEFINGLREKTPDNKSFWDEYQNCLKQSMENTGELAKEAFAHGGKVEPAGIKAYRYYVGENAFIPSENPKNKYGRGIYFSTNPERFREHGRKMIEAVITPKNPAVFESRHLPNLNYITAMREKGFTDKNDFNKSLFSAGHDAIIIKHSPAFGDEIILMDAKPVTSAIIMDGIMKEGGKAGKIKFDKNDIPSKRIYEYTQILKENYPKVWALGGNVFGNKAYKNLEKVLKRGYWLESEEWMYVKWKSFAARHAGDFLIAGIIANLKWMVWPARGSEYCKEVIREEIMKKYPEKEVLLKDGGEIGNRDTQYPEIINGFYSPIEKRIMELRAEKQSANKWLTLVGGKDEAVYTGVKAWLESKRPDEQVSKSEILDWMKNNRIEIVEVVKGGKEEGFLNNEWTPGVEENKGTGKIWKNSGWKVVENSNSDYSIFYPDGSQFEGSWSTKEGAFGRVRMVAPSGTTKHSQLQLQLPGEKENYKEVLVTLPVKKEIINWRVVTFEPKTGRTIKSDAPFRTKEDAEEIMNLMRDAVTEGTRVYLEQDVTSTGISQTGNFQSTHFDERNILVHLRISTRTDAEGNKVLFIEEIQSDWGQTGKRDGFKEEINELPEGYSVEEIKPTHPNVKELPSNYNLEQVSYQGWIVKNENKIIGSGWDKESARQNAIRNISTSTYYILDKNGERFGYRNDTKEDAIKNFIKHYNEELNRGKVPPAPFVTDTNAWTKLGLKFALREAVKQGASKIAWTTGEQQNERYSLEKQVDDVIISKNNDNTYDITPKFKNGSTQDYSKVPENKIQDYVGKELAIKAINDLKNTSIKKYEGIDLKVGGKGMIGYYDGIVPSVAKALVKELTGEKVEVGVTEIKLADKLADGYDITIRDERGNITTHGFDTKAKGLAWLSNQKNVEVIREKAEGIWTSAQPSIDITPELKQAVNAGMPLFFKGGNIEYPVMQDPETGEITRIMDKATELLENVRNITGATDGYTEIALDEDGDTMLSLYVEGDTGEKPGKVGNHFLSIVISDKQPTSYDIREFVFDSTNSAEEIIEFINEKIAELQDMEGIDGYPVKMEKGGYAGDTVTMNIPLLMRVFEQVREDVQDDKELHFMVERILDITRKGVLTMEDYDYISGALQNPKMQEEIADAGYEVQEMKKGGMMNKYAICTASLGRVHGMQRSLWDDETMEKYERCLESVEKRMEKGGAVLSEISGLAGQIKGVTEIDFEDDGKTLSYGTKTSKTRISVVGYTPEQIQEELELEEMFLKKAKERVESYGERYVALLKSKSHTKEDILLIEKQQKEDLQHIPIKEKIIIPFFENQLRKGSIAASAVPTKSFDEAIRRYKELAGRGQDPKNFIQSEFDISLVLGGQEYLEFYLAFAASDLSGKKLPAKQRLTAPEEIKGDTEIPLKLKEKSVKFTGIRDRTDILDLLKKIVGKDNLRPSMQGVYFDAENKAAVATDAHKLIFIPDDTIKKNQIINPYDGKVIDDKFPDWKMVIPQSNQIVHKIRVSVQYMLNVLHTVENSAGFFVKPPFVVINHGGEQYGFNAHIMYPVFEVMAKMGIDDVTIGLQSPKRAMLIESDTKSVTGLVMPIMLGLEERSYSGYPGIYTILDNGMETKSLPGGFAKSVKSPAYSEPTREQVREFMETLGILADSGDKNAAEFLETLKIVYA